ncbi:MAG: hypothetical protein MPJ50_17395 [Pirellulales bacterium]|nr:hypothetical protein [Pirellulales bacterium]
MQHREKILAMVAGAMGVILLANYLVNGAIDSIDKAKKDVASAEDKLQKAELKAHDLKRRNFEIQDWRATSLPSNLAIARGDYQVWLNQQADFSGLDVSPAGGGPKPMGGRDENKKPGFHLLTYHINGQGTLEQLSGFLYRFHRSNVLHRISQMTITPVKRQGEGQYTEDLQITATVKAVVMRDAVATTKWQPEIKEDARWTQKHFQEVVQYAILDRNLFKHNFEPRVSDIRDRRVGPNEDEITIRVSATDPEGRDLTYSLENQPSGMSINARSGRITFSPRNRDEDATYEDILVYVKDIGMMSRVVSKSFSVDVAKAAPEVEPPPEVPFDATKYSYITYLGNNGSGPRVVIDVRPTGEQPTLHAGETVEISGIVFTVVAIDLENERVTVSSEEKTQILNLGDSLAGFGTPVETSIRRNSGRGGSGDSRRRSSNGRSNRRGRGGRG